VVDVEPNKDDTVDEDVAVTIFLLPIAMLVDERVWLRLD
jgi:hypothetical protein